MKYLKLFELYNYNLIIKYDMDIIDIIYERSIDVNDMLFYINLKKNIPLKFNKINGHFNCSWNDLTSFRRSLQ